MHGMTVKKKIKIITPYHYPSGGKQFFKPKAGGQSLCA
jgi:hypothetical protein